MTQWKALLPVNLVELIESYIAMFLAFFSETNLLLPDWTRVEPNFDRAINGFELINPSQAISSFLLI